MFPSRARVRARGTRAVEHRRMQPLVSASRAKRLARAFETRRAAGPSCRQPGRHALNPVFNRGKLFPKVGHTESLDPIDDGRGRDVSKGIGRLPQAMVRIALALRSCSRWLQEIFSIARPLWGREGPKTSSLASGSDRARMISRSRSRSASEYFAKACFIIRFREAGRIAVKSSSSSTLTQYRMRARSSGSAGRRLGSGNRSSRNSLMIDDSGMRLAVKA